MDDLPEIARAAWPAANRATMGSVWRVVPRQGQGAPAPDDAVEEARWFGWVDHLPRRRAAAGSRLRAEARMPAPGPMEAGRGSTARARSRNLPTPRPR